MGGPSSRPCQPFWSLMLAFDFAGGKLLDIVRKGLKKEKKNSEFSTKREWRFPILNLQHTYFFQLLVGGPFPAWILVQRVAYIKVH